MSAEEIRKKLCDKDNQKAYQTLLEFEMITTESNELYPYFDLFLSLLDDKHSFVRVRGFRIICALAKWDKENKINHNIDKILKELEDNKGTSVRQCLDACSIMLLYKPELFSKVEEKLTHLNLKIYKENLQGLIKKDIETILSNE
ncbi:MAG: SufBD protein [Firmicutes bacterium]|nr:SufBD protein [Bacillota bacterium]